LKELDKIKNDEVPDIFSLDIEVLRRLHERSKGVTQMACILLVIKQIAGSNCNPLQMDELHNKFSTLVQHTARGETTLDHIVAQVLFEIEQIDKAVVSQRGRAQITGIITTMLAANSTVFKAIQNKVDKLLFEFLQGTASQTISDKDLASCMLLPMKNEIFELGSSLMLIATHNKNVHHKILNMLYSELKEK
jgi:hypothetical protein